MTRLLQGLVAVVFAGAVVFTTGATASAASTAGPYDTEDSCISARNEYNRYYDIDSACFQYPPIGGSWWFYYS